MKCTIYAKGEYLGNKDMPTVIEKLKEHQTEWFSDHEYEATALTAINDHNIGYYLDVELAGVISFVDEDGKQDSSVIDYINVESNKGLVTVNLIEGYSIRYKIEGKNIVPASPLVSTALESSWKHVTKHPLDTIFNMDNNVGSLSEILNGKELLDGNIQVIQSELGKLDEKNGIKLPEGHREHLANMMEFMLDHVKEIKGVKVNVSKDFVEGLEEPFGEFNSRSRTVRVATAAVDYAQNRLSIGNEETLVHEYVHAMFDILFNKNLDVIGESIKNDLRRLYSQAKKNTKWEDLLPENKLVTESEVAKAKEMYRYIFEGKIGDFSLKDAEVRLMEFLAYGITNPQLKKVIDTIELNTFKLKKNSNDSTITAIFKTIVNKLSDLLHNIKIGKRSDTIGQELGRLTAKLGLINKKHGYKVINSKNVTLDEKISKSVYGAMDKIDDMLHDNITKAYDKFSSAKDDELLKGTPDPKKAKDIIKRLTVLEAGFVKLSKAKLEAKKHGKLMKSAALSAKTMFIVLKMYKLGKESKMAGLSDLSREIDKALRLLDDAGDNFISDLLKDFRQGSKTLVKISDMTMQFKTRFDRIVDSYYKGAIQDLRTGFKNIDITAEQHQKYDQALNRVILRTDLQSITTDINRLKELLDDDSKVENRITALEFELEQAVMMGDFGDVSVGAKIVNEGKELAKYMLTRKGRRTNVQNILHRFGTAERTPLQANIQSLYGIKGIEAKLEELVSLYAFRDTDIGSKDVLKKLVSIDKDGVEYYLHTSHGMVNVTKENWWDGSMYQDMAKGQVFERRDKAKDLVFAPMADKDKMKAAGYRILRTMELDAADTDNTKYALYYTGASGLTSRVDGALGLQRLSIPGITLSQKVMQSNRHLNGKRLSEKIRRVLNEVRKQDSTDKMYPIYNNEGEIIDYRYEFTTTEKEKYWRLEVRGVENLARSFGQKDSQPRTDEHDRELVDILVVEQAKMTSKNKDEYIRIHAPERVLVKGRDLMVRTESEELWGLFPPDARKYIEGVNGKKEIYIRKELLKQLFGYDAISIADAKVFKKLSQKAKNRVRIGESWWMDAIQLAKSMVVVKLPRTIIGNILSNAKFFFFSGVNPITAAKYLILSYKSLAKWKKDERAIRDLERRIDISLDSRATTKLKKDLADLKYEESTNPIMPLINRGLYQTISEDIDTLDDNNKITDVVNKKMAALYGKSRSIEDVVNTVFLTKKSVLGKALLSATQESDFHFRAAIYWDGIKKGKTEEEMLRTVTDNFINYSRVINNKFVMWLDKMGPEAFWKYFSNIQRVNWKLFKENTTKVAIDTGIKASGVSWWPNDVLDSNLFSQLGKRFNPLNWFSNTESLLSGAAEIPISNLIDGY